MADHGKGFNVSLEEFDRVPYDVMCCMMCERERVLACLEIIPVIRGVFYVRGVGVAGWLVGKRGVSSMMVL